MSTNVMSNFLGKNESNFFFKNKSVPKKIIVKIYLVTNLSVLLSFVNTIIYIILKTIIGYY